MEARMLDHDVSKVLRMTAAVMLGMMIGIVVMATTALM